jgi:hypothetical protein
LGARLVGVEHLVKEYFEKYFEEDILEVPGALPPVCRSWLLHVPIRKGSAELSRFARPRGTVSQNLHSAEHPNDPELQTLRERSRLQICDTANYKSALRRQARVLPLVAL